MNYLKVIRTVFGIMAVIGFFIALGAVGRSDLADELGEYISIKDIFPQMLIGTLMMLPCGILEGFLDTYEINTERGKKHDNRHCIAKR